MKKTTPNYNKISNQIQCVIREIRMRKDVIPPWLPVEKLIRRLLTMN